MNLFRNNKKDVSHIELTPLIDMVFILLVFIMLSSSFLKPVINLILPIAEVNDTLKEDDILTVSVDNNKNIFVNNKKVSLAKLPSVLKTKMIINRKSKGVIFRSDKDVDYGFFLQIMDKLKQNNIQEISLEHESANK